MNAFHNDPKIKEKYLKRVMDHARADEIVKGRYWENGKGCAVGCTIHGDQHANYETELGIPEWLARVEDAIFEGLPEERAKTWPSAFLSAIKPGAKLDTIKTPFVIFILEQNLKTLSGLNVDPGYKDVIAAIKQTREATEQMIAAHRSGGDLSAARSAARSAAWSAAESAARSAESAARSAESAAWSAESAAWSAESAAESAAWSAESAAESAARSAESAARSAARSAAWSAESAAWSAAAYEKYADKLLDLIKDCE